ncbi:hypothetical protein SAMN02745866_02148 [Alteromonadaceae bacterium Bs31]|nr:hypothetical protein SAMN02745866_02148 [Alteromonadaceae bacterium Bs31]
MSANYFVEAGLLGFVFIAIWLAVHIVSYYKRNQANKELWATIFEGMTNKLVDLSPLKLPDSYIEKKAQKDGQDKDKLLSSKNKTD